MRLRTIVLCIAAVFVVLCGALVWDAVRSEQAAAPVMLAAGAEGDVDAVEEAAPVMPATEAAVPVEAEAASIAAAPVVYPELSAVSGREETVKLGALYPEATKRTEDESKYKFEVELTTLGAAVKTATLSEFDNRNPDDRRPLMLLAPLSGGRDAYSLSNTALRVAPAGAMQFGTKAFPLDRLNWRSVSGEDKNTATFEAVLADAGTGDPTLRLTKTYRVRPGSYDLVCELTAENLTETPMQAMMEIRGPVGMTREDTREDTRKVMTAYLKGTEVESRLMRATDIRIAEREKIRPEQGFFTQLKGLFSKPTPPEERLKLGVKNGPLPLLWTATTNKYFAAIVRSVGEELMSPGPVRFSRAVFYDAALMTDTPSENAGAAGILETEAIVLAAATHEGCQQTVTFEMYLGPKDKSIFEANETYRKLAYFQTIDFRGCCCPTSVIGPLAFGIMWLIKAMYTLMGPLGNYGVVIIFLVFVVRLILHPVTKRSQVSMMKMQKLGPKMQEIQKKYANNKQEMNRKMMEMYKEMGASPVSGMLPMFLQMPIWIALWTAVYTSVDLRGQAFLPYWITDLSAPDHLFRFPFGLAIPYFGEYLNLLPLLMGGVMYAQQKLMPSSQASMQANPQVAQQQKMMMIMMPLMFPLLLYHGPSGVNLYIMSSIGAGVIEQIVIRKHIREREALEAMGTIPVTAKTGGKLKKKKPKPMFKYNKS